MKKGLEEELFPFESRKVRELSSGLVLTWIGDVLSVFEAVGGVRKIPTASTTHDFKEGA